MKFFLFVLLIIALTILNIGKSLNLSLAGDDWNALYHYHLQFDSFSSYFQLSRYIGIYDFSFILMGILQKLFAYNPFPYYLISMIIRIAVALSFYPSVLSLTKSRMAAYLTCVLFAFAYGGIESTNWVFNMATYISLGFFNLFLWQYFSHINKQNIKGLFLESFLLFSSFYAAPNRMATLLIIAPIIEIATPGKLELRSFVKRSVRVSLLLLPIILFHLATASKNDKDYATMIPHLTLNNFNVIFYFFSNIGSSLIPDKIFHLLLPNLSVPNINNLGVFIAKSFFIVLSFVVLIYLLSMSIFKKNSFLISTYSLLCIYTLIFWLSLQGGTINEFGNLLTFLETLIGGYTFIVFSLYFINIRNSFPYLSRAGIYSLFASLLFLAAPWLAFTGNYPSDHRYLLIPTALLMVFIAVLTSLLLKQKNKIFAVLSPFVILIIILMNFLSSQSYFDQYLSQGRKADYADKLFKEIISSEKYPESDKPLVFLFITDDNLRFYNAIGFGFDTHFMQTNPYLAKHSKNLQLPINVDSKESLVSILKDPNSTELKRYGHPPTKIPLGNVFSFYLIGDKLLPNTKQLRKEIEPLLN